jgi:hypothetical protein
MNKYPEKPPKKDWAERLEQLGKTAIVLVRLIKTLISLFL